MKRKEPPCPHYMGLQEGHCYKCLHAARARDRQAFVDAFMESFEAWRRGRYSA